MLWLIFTQAKVPLAIKAAIANAAAAKDIFFLKAMLLSPPLPWAETAKKRGANQAQVLIHADAAVKRLSNAYTQS
jgi:hypothetical protein